MIFILFTLRVCSYLGHYHVLLMKHCLLNLVKYKMSKYTPETDVLENKKVDQIFKIHNLVLRDQLNEILINNSKTEN